MGVELLTERYQGQMAGVLSCYGRIIIPGTDLRRLDRNVITSLLRMWLLIDGEWGTRYTPDCCKQGLYTPQMFFGRDEGGPFIATLRPGEQKPLKCYPLGEKKAVARVVADAGARRVTVRGARFRPSFSLLGWRAAQASFDPLHGNPFLVLF